MLWVMAMDVMKTWICSGNELVMHVVVIGMAAKIYGSLMMTVVMIVWDNSFVLIVW